jgi:hypothetical protein
MKRYTVLARRVGNWWALDVEGVHGAHTQVRRIDQAEEMAREAIAGVLDIAPTAFEVVVAPEVPADARTAVTQATRARLEAAQAQEAASKLTQHAARRLVETGLTVRDAGVLLGVSHQRIAQLVGQWRSTAMAAQVDLENQEAARRAAD